MFKSFVSMRCAVPTLTSAISASSLTVKRLSVSSADWIDATLDAFTDFFLPDLCSSFSAVCPSKNFLCHLNTNARHTLSFPLACCNIVNVSVADLPKFIQNLMFARISRRSCVIILTWQRIRVTVNKWWLHKHLSTKWRHFFIWRHWYNAQTVGGFLC